MTQIQYSKAKEINDFSNDELLVLVNDAEKRTKDEITIPRQLFISIPITVLSESIG